MSDDEFAKIRPCRDEEVPSVLARLLADEKFLQAVVVYRFPRLARIAPGLLRALTARILARRVASFDTVDDCQFSLESWFDRMIADTTAGLSWSGIDALDPCDAMKAHELQVKAETGSYEKPPGEYIQSIVTGITGAKSRAHVHCGPELTNPPADANGMATRLDDGIQRGFRLSPTHLEAWRRRGGALPAELESAVGPLTSVTLERFDARLAALPEVERAFLLLQYATPVANHSART